MDRMVINAAIERLIAKTGTVDDAKLIITFCEKIPYNRWGSIEGSFAENGSSITGATEHGNVTVRDEKERVEEFSLGARRERVGYYKIERIQKYVLSIQHFWKSDVTTESENGAPAQYLLGHSKDSTPEFFGVVISEEWKTFHFFSLTLSIIRNYLEVFFGDARCLRLPPSFRISFY